MLVEIMKINKEDVTIVTCLDIAETFEKKAPKCIEGYRASAMFGGIY